MYVVSSPQLRMCLCRTEISIRKILPRYDVITRLPSVAPHIQTAPICKNETGLKFRCQWKISDTKWVRIGIFVAFPFTCLLLNTVSWLEKIDLCEIRLFCHPIKIYARNNWRMFTIVIPKMQFLCKVILKFRKLQKFNDCSQLVFYFWAPPT